MDKEFVKHVGDSSFDKMVLKSGVPVLVDFWAPWCGPCRKIGPMIEELAQDYSGRIDVVKVNIDESPKTAQSFGIRSIPTLLFVKEGKVFETIVGAAPKNQLEAVIERMLP